MVYILTCKALFEIVYKEILGLNLLTLDEIKKKDITRESFTDR